jgi:iron complex outermembrane recepter protein
MNLRIFALLGSVFGISGLLLLAPTAANAQQAAQAEAQSGGLEEIVVTAQRREEKSVDVPISITALSAQQLATANVQTLSDIERLTPSLRFDNQAGFFQPTIRGIGTGVTTSGGGENVGIYIDGFYSPNPLAGDFQLGNVSNIQVLKGPQGTLFGHNTTGGAIVVQTPDPSFEPAANVSVSYARFATQKYEAYATGPIAGIVAADFSGVYTQSSGYLRNIISNVTLNNYANSSQDWTIRTGVKFQFSDAVSVLLRYTHSRQADPTAIETNSNTDTSINLTTGKPWGVQTFAVPGLYTTNPSQVADNLPTYVVPVTDIETVTVKADLGFANLTSLSQYREEQTQQSENLDQTALPIFQLGLPIYDYTESQEFLLNSKPGPRLQWTGGLYYLEYTDTYFTYIDNYIGTPVGRIRLGGSSTTTQNIAGYFDATYQLTDQLFFTGGVRYAHDAVINAYYNLFNATGLPPQPPTNFQYKVPSINSTKATPRAVLRYKLTDDSNVYASYTEGYKAAILDVGGSCQDAFDNYKCNNVQPEDVHAYEVGYKFDNHRISNEAAAFLYNYSNLQVSEYRGGAQAYIINAAESRIYGLEDQLKFNLNEYFQVNAAASWTHAHYVQFGTLQNGVTLGAPIYATCTPSLCAPGSYAYVNTDTILHQVPMQNAPAYTATLGPRVSTGMTSTGEYSLSQNLYYTSKIFFGPCGCQFLQPAYITLDVRGEWTPPSKKFYVAVFGQNVTNDRYRTAVQYNGFGVGGEWSAPAIWGVEFGAKY